jgi:hypothetical protein
LHAASAIMSLRRQMGSWIVHEYRREAAETEATCGGGSG